ncbi:uncharacterized protein LOC123193213 isoform X2 [Mangifera indica]|uniref:uncharacterized protein LOC123193213 isoform X2 n=1 Tax=Mangifera indica TaxID=29780 RepID=UPI001CFA0340|nr:uncharacterized protein LOC123193213 isoform X2 [Mangifera indica]
MQSVLWVMPLKRFVTDAFGVATICLVAILIFLGLLCIAYLFYFRSQVRSQGFIQLSYFSGPWIIRITFILFAIWWGCGEIIRLSYLRREGKVLNALDLKWQQNVCKGYVVSNLGFAEPCLFLTLVFLLRAPLQRLESGILSQKWNGKTATYVFLYCFPVFILQLFIILIGPRLQKDKNNLQNLPRYFTSTSATNVNIALCTYPLLSTILLGLFATVLTVYLFWLGRRILQLVINKGLQKRVYALIVSVSSFLPLRVLLLGLSVLSKPEDVLFEVLAFLSFLALLFCAGVCIFMLVYCPVADSLALGNLLHLEARRRFIDEHNDIISLVANQCRSDESVEISLGRNSDTSTKRGSMSFGMLGRDGTSSGSYVELSLFSPSHNATPPESPSRLGWPMRHPVQE